MLSFVFSGSTVISGSIVASVTSNSAYGSIVNSGSIVTSILAYRSAEIAGPAVVSATFGMPVPLSGSGSAGT